MLRDFIWEGYVTTTRVNFEQLTKKLEDDGLQLFDIALKNIVFKAQWVKRTVSARNFWVKHAKDVMPWNIPDIWLCNLKSTDVKRLLKRHHLGGHMESLV